MKSWRQPSVPLAVSEHELATGETGRPQLDYKARWDQEEINRRLEGYVCLQCWEPHEIPFPETCFVCGYPMRERQLVDFSKQYQGNERNPRAELIERELDRVDEIHEQNFHVNKLGIVIPKTI